MEALRLTISDDFCSKHGLSSTASWAVVTWNLRTEFAKCPDPGSAQEQAGWSPEHPGTVEGVPVMAGVALDEL